MATDVLLGDNDVTVDAPQLTLHQSGLLTQQKDVALDLRNSTGFWHLSGPRSYEAGNPFSIFWNNNSAWSNPLLTVTTAGQVGIGTSADSGPLQGQLQIHGGEVHSTGNVAGFSFLSRDLANGQQTQNGSNERFVWYAQGGYARLWCDGHDLLTVRMAYGKPEVTIHGVLRVDTIVADTVLNSKDVQGMADAVQKMQGGQSAPFVPLIPKK